MSEYLTSAQKLHQFLNKNFWNGEVLVGPDIGVRFNSRFWRFIKSYLPFVTWADNLIYMQSQGYWILCNWMMFDLSNDEKYKEIAVSCSNNVLRLQKKEGYWDYPNPEWKGKVATVEGNFAAIGLLESYHRTQQTALLDGALKWYQYLVTDIGFHEEGDLLAIKYFSDSIKNGIPNNSTLTLWLLAKLADTTNNSRYLEFCRGMVNWLRIAQLQSGELPYGTAGLTGEGRTHFLCYQYNAFQFLDLSKYYRMTNDQDILPVLEKLSGYLSTGITNSGACRYNCHQKTPETGYYTMAIGTALSEASRLGLNDYSTLANQAFQRVIQQQRPDGGFKFFSKRNYGFLMDKRSYPRHLTMILHHLLMESQFSK
jgi:hypothetical protein